MHFCKMQLLELFALYLFQLMHALKMQRVCRYLQYQQLTHICDVQQKNSTLKTNKALFQLMLIRKMQYLVFYDKITQKSQNCTTDGNKKLHRPIIMKILYCSISY